MYIWLASPKPSELFCPVGHPFLSSFALLLRSFNTPLLPWLIRPTSLMSHSSLGLTLLPIPVPVAPRPTRERLDSEITLLPPAVLTDWIPSLSTPSVCWSVSMPFRGGHSRYGYPGDTIHHVTLFLPTYRDCTLHVPWRLWKERDSNPRCPTLFRRLSEALSIQRLFQCCLRPLSHPSLILCLAIPSQGHAAPHLSSFISSYSPFAMFNAIWCCG